MKKLLTITISLFIASAIYSQNLTINLDSVDRSYLLYVPETYKSTDTTWLVLGFHGSGESAEEFSQVGFNRLADEMEFIVAYPNGQVVNGNREWMSDEQDRDFIRQLIDTLTTNYKIDTNRIYSTGYSAGGFFSYDLAFYLEDKIAAIAPMSGLFFKGFLNDFVYEEVAYDALYDTIFPTPVLHIHAVDDQMVSYNASGRDLHYPVQEGIAVWVEANECSAPDTIYKSSLVTGILWKDEANGNDVVLYKYPAGMHTKMRYAVELVCDFFYNHPKRKNSIQITTPVLNEFHELGETITISAEANTAEQVDSVTFYANNSLLSSDTEAPYECNWTEAEYGEYKIKAKLHLSDGSAYISSNPSIINVLPASVYTSSSKDAFDNDFNTRWESSWNDNAYLRVDLGAIYKINAVSLFWEIAYGKAYKIEVSEDRDNWTTVYETSNSDGDKDFISFDSIETRYVKMQGVKRALPYGYSLWEMQVHGRFVRELPEPSSAIQTNFSEVYCKAISYGSSVNIDYCLTHSSAVKFEIYTLQGRKIEEQTIKNQSAGIHKCLFDLTDEVPGVYVFRAITASYFSSYTLFIE